MAHAASVERGARAKPSLARSAALFVAIGAVLYLALYAWSERLVYRTGDSNPFFKIATAPRSGFDWVVLGASHAMPLDFGDFNAVMERETGLSILNLAATGAGPLYNRFVLEHFLRERGTANLLYVVDSFAFYDGAWNEGRFADVKLLRRTPFDAALAGAFFSYALREGVDWRVPLDYATGFSKINNPERFRPDRWEGETQFERTYRPSGAAEARRLEYLFPAMPAGPAELERNLDTFEALLEEAQRSGAAVTVVKLPMPASFHRRLPREPEFDAALAARLAARGIPFRDFSGALPEPRHYFDTDHLNRAGAAEFFARHLRDLLSASARY